MKRCLLVFLGGFRLLKTCQFREVDPFVNYCFIRFGIGIHAGDYVGNSGDDHEADEKAAEEGRDGFPESNDNGHESDCRLSVERTMVSRQEVKRKENRTEIG